MINLGLDLLTMWRIGARWIGTDRSFNPWLITLGFSASAQADVACRVHNLGLTRLLPLRAQIGVSRYLNRGRPGGSRP
jgi:hypothetical protein